MVYEIEGSSAKIVVDGRKVASGGVKTRYSQIVQSHRIKQILIQVLYLKLSYRINVQIFLKHLKPLFIYGLCR